MSTRRQKLRFGDSMLAAFVVAAPGCRHKEPPGSRVRPTSSVIELGNEAVRVDRILAAEYGRDEKAVPPEALTSRDVGLRRLAARALARIADEGAIKRLEKGLGDDDPEVVAWSAYGLGYGCRGHEDETVRRLTVRAPSLPADAGRIGTSFEISPIIAVADALARCGGATAERVLVSWLDGGHTNRSSAAILALGRLAGEQHRLSDEAIVALLDKAALADSDADALYPLSRLEALSEATSKRLAEVAKNAISFGGMRRTFAIRALASAGDAGIELLADAFADVTMSATDRSAAATGLGRIGQHGKPAVARALEKIVPGATTIDERFVATNFSPIAAMLSAPAWPNADAREPLSRLSDAPLPGGATPALARRIIALRCSAAAALAGKASRSKALVSCDPNPEGRAFALAQLRVLDRGDLRGARFTRWRELAESKDLGVRRAALALIPTHGEMPPIVDLLARALAAPEPGIAAQAARVIATEPKRASSAPITEHAGDTAQRTRETEIAADQNVVDALGHAMDAARPPDQIEARVAFMDAAAAIGNLSLKSRVERYCRSDNVTLRRHAERDLSLLGRGGASCPAPAATATRSAEDAPIVAKTLTLTFLTDAGRLAMTLDPELAPFAVSRIVTLARAGFYDNLRIHRVTPGFVVQLGDPVGDGSGGSGRSPLPCETSPVDFSALTVGVALSGRDTGSSQIFVTLSPEPQLDGDYAAIGRADPEWAGAAEGDIIQRVEVR